MHTLQEFMTHVKGMGYILAGIVMLAFVAFWFFLTGTEKKK